MEGDCDCRAPRPPRPAGPFVGTDAPNGRGLRPFLLYLCHLLLLSVGTDAPNGRGLRPVPRGETAGSRRRSVPTPRMEGDCDHLLLLSQPPRGGRSSVPTPRMEGDCDSSRTRRWNSANHVGTDAPNGRGLRPAALYCWYRVVFGRYRRPEWKGIATADLLLPPKPSSLRRYRRPEWKGIATASPHALLRALVLGRYRRPEWKGIATCFEEVRKSAHVPGRYRRPEWKGIATPVLPMEDRDHFRQSVPTPRMEGDCDVARPSIILISRSSVPTPRMEGDCDVPEPRPRGRSRGSVPTPRMEGDCDDPEAASASGSLSVGTDAPNGRGLRPTQAAFSSSVIIFVGTDAPNGRGLRLPSLPSIWRPTQGSVPTPRMEGDCDAIWAVQETTQPFGSVPTPRMEGDCDGGHALPPRAVVFGRYRRPEWKGIATWGSRCADTEGRSRSVPTPRMEGDCDEPVDRRHDQIRTVGTDAPNGRGLRLVPAPSPVPIARVGTDAPNGRGLRLLCPSFPAPDLGVGTDAPNGRGLRRAGHGGDLDLSLPSVPTPRMEGDCDRPAAPAAALER